jgi:hypothetical protein
MKKLVIAGVVGVVSLATATIFGKKIKKLVKPKCDICGGVGYFEGEFYGNLAPEMYDCDCKKNK